MGIKIECMGTKISEWLPPKAVESGQPPRAQELRVDLRTTFVSPRRSGPVPGQSAPIEFDASSAEFAQPTRVSQGQAHQVLGFKLAESAGNCGVLAERLMTVRATTIGNQQSWDRVPTMAL